MALNTKQGCCQYFEDTVVPRLRTEFPNLDYTSGRDFAYIRFEGTRQLKKYNNIFVWMKRSLQGVYPPAIISSSLMSIDSGSIDDFQWDDLDVMIAEICKFEREYMLQSLL